MKKFLLLALCSLSLSCFGSTAVSSPTPVPEKTSVVEADFGFEPVVAVMPLTSYSFECPELGLIYCYKEVVATAPVFYVSYQMPEYSSPSLVPVPSPPDGNISDSASHYSQEASKNWRSISKNTQPAGPSNALILFCSSLFNATLPSAPRDKLS